MTLVLDATVLLNFGRVQALWLIVRAASGPLVVLDEVAAEVLRPEVAVEQLNHALSEGSMRRHTLATEEELTLLSYLRQRTPGLGSGEAASLAACLANGWAFATDDRRARRLATSLMTDTDIGLSGTLGILVAAVEQEVIDGSEAQRLLDRMIQEGFRSPFTRLSDLLGSRQPTTHNPATPAE